MDVKKQPTIKMMMSRLKENSQRKGPVERPGVDKGQVEIPKVAVEMVKKKTDIKVHVETDNTREVVKKQKKQVNQVKVKKRETAKGQQNIKSMLICLTSGKKPRKQEHESRSQVSVSAETADSSEIYKEKTVRT